MQFTLYIQGLTKKHLKSSGYMSIPPPMVAKTLSLLNYNLYGSVYYYNFLSECYNASYKTVKIKGL